MIGGVNVAADDEELGSARDAPTINRTLSVKFMGKGDTPQDTSPGKAKLTSSDKDSKFWVGVVVDKVDDLPLFTKGVYSMEVAFEYDPTFVEPYYVTASPDSEWQTLLEDGNLGSANDAAWWDKNQYSIISVLSTDIDTTTDRENLSEAATRKSEGWKMCTVCVTVKEGETVTDARFKDLDSSGDQCLLKLPFRLKKAPSENDSDQNPTVLSLVKGPETLDIGSDSKGTIPYSEWRATVTDWDDTTNMKTLFKDGGDISLFSTGASVSSIVPTKLKTGEETDNTVYTLSQTKDLQQEDFDGDKYEYYLSVPNETEKIMLDITSSDAPTVKANGTDVNTTLDSGQLYKTSEFTLSELNKDTDNGGEEDGFNNTVTVTAGGTTYTIHIRRLMTPKIVLNYGNSPYGEIMKDDNITDKALAKQAFDVGNKYTTSYCPTGCNTSVVYIPYAWNTDETSVDNPDDKDNMDKNDFAIFVYQGEDFTDPGFTAYNSLGEEVSDKAITRSLSVACMKAYGTANMADTATSEYSFNVDNEKSQYTFSELTNKYIRPDIYKIKYTFTDSYTNEECSVERNLIMLWTMGDADLSGIRNGGDVTTINKILKGTSVPLKNVTGVTRCIYTFRVLDADRSGIFNGGDATTVTKILKGTVTEKVAYRHLN
jgi:hypothetical protein